MTKQKESKNKQVRVFARDLVNPGFAQHDKVISVQGGKITEISSIAGQVPDQDDIDVRNATVIPGLIDIHIHGAYDESFMDDCSAKSRGFLASQGTTAFLATNGTAVRKESLASLRNLRRRISEQRPHDGAQILGIRCECPFLEPSLGAQKAELCWPITSENISALLDTAGEDLRILDVSPELGDAATLIKQAVDRGIIVSAAHTRAGAEQMQRAFRAGLSHMTHIFNATERPPSKAGTGTLGVGANEFTLTNDAMTAEVIADCQGFHVSPYWLEILFRCKNRSKICLISDATSIAGQAPGKYPRPDGNRIVLRAGEDVGWLESEDKTGLCGSAMTLRDAMVNLMSHMQMNLEQALECATLNPATILGLEQQKGSIEKGKDADLVVLGENLQVVLTIIAGEVVFGEQESKSN